MKLTGQIQGVGKIGTIVVSKVAGECIARQYNPTIANPNTSAQVEQRAKLKLASQLSAALATSIVMQKEGLVSARNKFVKANIGSISYAGGMAQVSYENLQLTDGNIGLPAIEATRANSKLTIQLAEAAPAGIARVVYEVYRKSSEGQLLKAASLVVSTAGDANLFPVEIDDISGDIVLYAYGMRDLSAAATAKYNNYGVTSGDDIARLVASRSISKSDYNFTQTRGTTLFAGSNENVVAPEGSHIVYITAGNGGSVSGTGFSNGRKAVAEGEQVAVVATPASENTFDGWYLRTNGQQTLVSNQPNYTFTMGQNNVDLLAVFVLPDNDDVGGDDY